MYNKYLFMSKEYREGFLKKRLLEVRQQIHFLQRKELELVDELDYIRAHDESGASRVLDPSNKSITDFLNE